MKLFVFLWTSVALFASAQAQDGSQAQVAQVGISQTEGAADTPAPTVKPLDIAEMLGTVSPKDTRNVTIPTRPDPRATEAPTPQPTPPPTPAPTPDPGPWVEKKIGHDEVKPFPQPEPVTIAERAGVKFKPQIQIRTGCVPYPAVDSLGQTSGGLQTSGSPKGGCRGSGHGSQVYGRSTWFNGVWAIMYSWYFPKDSPSSRMGHRHDWEHIVVFIDNPDIPEPKILGCSPSSHSGYKKHSPCPPWVIDGSSVKVRYKHSWPINHDLDTTGDGGTFQDLIMWDQMTDEARRALNSVSFGSANTPFNDRNFLGKVEKSSPF